jgi:hypothetical protein
MRRLTRAGELALVLVALAGALRAEPADPNVERARELYAQARRAFQEERYREAAFGFEAASKLHPHAVALYTAAQAWELAGERPRAADAYARALELPGLSDNQTARARERLAVLTPELGVVLVTGDAATQVQLDEQMQMTLPARLHGTPGAHTLVIVYADGGTDRQAVMLERGMSVERSAAKAAPAEQPRIIPLAEPRKHGVHLEDEQPRPFPWFGIGLVTTGAGVASLGGAIVLGSAAKDAESTYKAAPTRETLDHARSLETSTNVMLVIGAVLTAGGAGIVVWQATRKPAETGQIEVRAAPGGVGVKGRF